MTIRHRMVARPRAPRTHNPTPFVVAALALALCAAVAWGSIVAGPTVYNGHRYYVLAPAPWWAAENEARALGGHLVAINDQAEQDFVFALVGAWSTSHWIGFTDQGHEGNWTWASGEAGTYANWNLPWEPNNYGGHENCGALEVAWGGRWNDLRCDSPFPSIAEAPDVPCVIRLYLPVYDGQTWVGGCNARMNGVVLTDPGCPVITRIGWDWGDGGANDHWFPGAHTYERNGSYTVTVTPFDASGASTSATVELDLTTCDPLGPVDPVLYATDFQSFANGTVNGQDEWVVGVLSYPGNPVPYPSSAVGQVVDTGSGQNALQVRATSGWGDEVGRFYPRASLRFVAVTFDFQTPNDYPYGGFWFIDNKEHGPATAEVRSIFLWQSWLRTNALPGSGAIPHQRDRWHRTGMEIDRATSRIVAFFFDGSWSEVDSSLAAPVPAGFNLFYFNTYGTGQRLWVDNLRVSESGAPLSSRGTAVALAALVEELPPTVFVNPNRQNALGNKLDEVLALVEAGFFAEAYDKLVHDILKKTDGCATGGAPDANDWIDDCPTQALVREKVLALIDLLETLR